MKVLVLCLIAVVWLQLPSEGNAECCWPNLQLRCWDCTGGTPYCGHGRCDVIGCNCEGGCRQGKCFKKRSLYLSAEDDITTPHDVVRAADANEDGRMSVEEAHSFMVKRGLASEGLKRSLYSLDANNDNFISAEEIEPNTQH